MEARVKDLKFGIDERNSKILLSLIDKIMSIKYRIIVFI